MIQSEFTLIDPKPSLFNRIVVSLVYSVFIAYVLYLIREKIIVQKIDTVVVVIYMIWVLGVILMMTVGSVSRHGIQFSFKEMKIRHFHDISIYRYKEAWQALNELNYLSIYKDDGNYNVIMWYEETNFLNLFSLKKYEDIVERACSLSNHLNIDLLDATINDDLNHWIDKEAYKKTSEINHLN